MKFNIVTENLYGQLILNTGELTLSKQKGDASVFTRMQASFIKLKFESQFPGREFKVVPVDCVACDQIFWR